MGKEIKSLDERTKLFNEELQVILGKYEIGLVAIPFVHSDGRVMARVSMFDDSAEAKKITE